MKRAKNNKCFVWIKTEELQFLCKKKNVRNNQMWIIMIAAYPIYLVRESLIAWLEFQSVFDMLRSHNDQQIGKNIHSLSFVYHFGQIWTSRITITRSKVCFLRKVWYEMSFTKWFSFARNASQSMVRLQRNLLNIFLLMALNMNAQSFATISFLNKYVYEERTHTCFLKQHLSQSILYRRL